MSFFLCFLFCFVQISRANFCTDFFCDSGLINITFPDAGYDAFSPFCGTDLMNHVAGAGQYICYILICNVSVFYPGSCGCPNNCSGNGACVGGTCVCNNPWTGRDCFTVASSNGTCPACNSSSCSLQENISFCDCPVGRTSLFCDIPVNPPQTKQVMDGTYYHADKYGDDHPVFNQSVIATTRITLNETDFLALFEPTNMFSNDMYNVTFLFTNGNIQEYREGVGMRKKGFVGSRIFPKKAYKLKFNWQTKGEKWKGMKAINFKGAEDPAHMIDMMSVQFYRSLVLPTYRASYSALYINNVYLGIYFMHEDLDDEFLDSRYGYSTGNFYKGNGGCLNYLGDDPEIYKNKSAGGGLFNVTQPTYNQMEGDGNFSDLVQLIKVINMTDTLTSKFEYEIEKILDVESFLRSSAINALMGSFDDYATNCNNYIMYHHPITNLFVWSAHDWTLSMAEYSPLQNMSEVWNRSVFYSSNNPFDGADYPVLFTRVMNVPNFRARYVKILQTILRTLWIPYVNSSVQIDGFRDYIYKLVAYDLIGAMFREVSYASNVLELKEFVWNRTRAVILEIGLPSNFYVSASFLSAVVAGSILVIGASAVVAVKIKRDYFDLAHSGYTMVPDSVDIDLSNAK